MGHCLLLEPTVEAEAAARVLIAPQRNKQNKRRPLGRCATLHPAGGAVGDRGGGFVTVGEEFWPDAPLGAALDASLTVYCTHGLLLSYYTLLFFQELGKKDVQVFTSCLASS